MVQLFPYVKYSHIWLIHNQFDCLLVTLTIINVNFGCSLLPVNFSLFNSHFDCRQWNFRQLQLIDYWLSKVTVDNQPDCNFVTVSWQ